VAAMAAGAVWRQNSNFELIIRMLLLGKEGDSFS
jgi:hypothetical protein